MNKGRPYKQNNSQENIKITKYWLLGAAPFFLLLLFIIIIYYYYL